ncbi:hypothetical protein HOU45_gp36 [Microbacterium phage Armstrong]|uniref:Uncharacterized protein n=1 Tax=Microbacterium phage Armstrong TaxID=2419971 RepID=A0A3G2KDA7_9CAUD|nr:hypothetical protein HOU45_gp36 [Microbacterium phage Armstrong]AYN56921.1 hypothetical protein PBI_ARMSTRONG_36 [Microbacterium phage Armstrong]
MNNNKRPAVTIYVDGVCMGTLYGWKNIREAEAKYTARGAIVELARA